MLPTFLDGPDDDLDSLDTLYSPDIARVLHVLYAPLPAARFHEVDRRLEVLLTASMGLRQRVRLHHALAESYLHAGQVEAAADHLHNALEDVETLGDAAAFATLALRQAHLHYLSHSIVSAREYALDALDAFRSLANGDIATSATTLDFGLQLLWELATHAFLLEEYDEAQGYVQEAHALMHAAAPAVRPPQRTASIAWTTALIQRWRRRPFPALAWARQAMDHYGRQPIGVPEERPRMALVLAEIAMDAAQHLSPEVDDLTGSMAIHLIDEAGVHVHAALNELTKIGDALGLARGQLIMARHARLTYDNVVDRGVLYAAIEHLCRVSGDRPLHCHLWTERGDDFLAQGQESAALECYRHALEVIGRSDASAMGMWARTALIGRSHH